MRVMLIILLLSSFLFVSCASRRVRQQIPTPKVVVDTNMQQIYLPMVLTQDKLHKNYLPMVIVK